MANILVVDDSAVDRRLVAGLLKEDPNIEVELAENGREAIEMLRNKQFDLVVTDLQMPELDGLAATTRIRELEADTGVHTPIIAMTAHALKGDAERCLQAGMDAYQTKPVQAVELLRTIARLLGIDDQNATLVSASDASASGNADASLADTRVAF